MPHPSGLRVRILTLSLSIVDLIPTRAENPTLSRKKKSGGLISVRFDYLNKWYPLRKEDIKSRLPRNVPPEWIAERGSVGLVMTTAKPLADPQLSPEVRKVLGDFVEAARNSFGDQLRSVTLFGSAAEGKLRPTSDVNLVVVLSAFEKTRADQLRQPLRLSQAAIQLRPMFVLDSEIPDATRSFAPKFADILRRRVVLYGDDSFSTVSVPREAEIRQLRQQLLNITLRLRAAYVARSLREEQLASFIAGVIGPLRSATAALLELEGHPATSPERAFELLGLGFQLPAWGETLSLIAAIQDALLPPSGAAQQLVFQLLEFARLAATRVDSLSGEVRRESL